MDLIHIFLAVGMFLMVVIVTWGAVNIAWSLQSIEQTQEKIANMVERNEKVTLDILQKVYGVSSRQ